MRLRLVQSDNIGEPGSSGVCQRSITDPLAIAFAGSAAERSRPVRGLIGFGIWMAFWAALLGWMRRVALSTLLPHIGDVVGIGAQKEVIGIATRRVVAIMQHQQFPRITAGEHPSVSMSKQRSALQGEPLNAPVAAAIAVPGIQPAAGLILAQCRPERCIAKSGRTDGGLSIGVHRKPYSLSVSGAGRIASRRGSIHFTPVSPPLFVRR